MKRHYRENHSISCYPSHLTNRAGPISASRHPHSSAGETWSVRPKHWNKINSNNYQSQLSADTAVTSRFGLFELIGKKKSVFQDNASSFAQMLDKDHSRLRVHLHFNFTYIVVFQRLLFVLKALLPFRKTINGESRTDGSKLPLQWFDGQLRDFSSCRRMILMSV